MIEGENGVVELASGRWWWSARHAENGYVVSFRHATRPKDEMKTWMDPNNPESILEAARNPVYRAFEDFDGAMWLAAVQFGSLKADSPLWLTFKNAIKELAVLMPPERSLGELTTEELVRCLREAQ